MYGNERDSTSLAKKVGAAVITGAVVTLLILGYVLYLQFRIDVPSYHMAILTHRTGKDLPNNMEVAPDASYKGVQLEVLNEGRYFYNPYAWDWEIVPMVEIPKGKLGVRIRLHGEELPYGHVVAKTDKDNIQKFKLAVDAFGSPAAYNNWIFASQLPEDIKLKLFYAGPGTLWTDLGKSGGVQMTYPVKPEEK